MKKRLGEIWEGYRKIIPAGASEVQVRETRRAFYAGATALFTAMLSSLSPGTESEPEDEAMMDELNAELREFELEVRQNRA